MKKAAAILAALCCMTLAGCAGPVTLSGGGHDIGRFELIQTIGVDLNEDRTVTVSASSPAGGEEGAAPLALKCVSGTVVGALKQLHNYSAKDRLFYDHTQNYVLGEAAARENLQGYLDFIRRDMNMRLDIALFIAKGGTAEQIVAHAGGADSEVSAILNSMQKNLSLLTDGYVFSCGEVAANLAERSCSLVSAVRFTPSDNAVSEDAEAAVLQAGYGILKDGVLIGYVDEELTAGVNLLLGKAMEADILELPDGQGGRLAVWITLDSSEFLPVYRDGSLVSVDARVKLSASIDMVDSGVNVHDPAVLQGLEEDVSRTLSQKAEGVINLSQDMKLDFLGIEKSVQLDAPLKFAKLGEAWTNLFPTVPFYVTVETTIARTNDMRVPAEVVEEGVHAQG